MPGGSIHAAYSCVQGGGHADGGSPRILHAQCQLPHTSGALIRRNFTNPEAQSSKLETDSLFRKFARSFFNRRLKVLSSAGLNAVSASASTCFENACNSFTSDFALGAKKTRRVRRSLSSVWRTTRPSVSRRSINFPMPPFVMSITSHNSCCVLPSKKCRWLSSHHSERNKCKC